MMGIDMVLVVYQYPIPNNMDIIISRKIADNQVKLKLEELFTGKFYS